MASVCEKLEACPFFTGKISTTMPSVVEGMKKKYCLADKESCARYILFKAGYDVPDNMFPVDHKRAESIMSGK